MAEFVQHLIDALSAGSAYVLLGLGLTLVFSVMGLVNFAYGSLIVWGGYALVTALDAGAPYWLALVALVVGVTFLSWAMGAVAFRPFRNAPPATLLLTSFGVSLVLQALASSLFGDASKNVPFPRWLGESTSIAGVYINALQAVTVVGAVVVLVGLYLTLQRTTLGLHIRAAAEDPDISRLLGVRSDRVLTTVFVISGLIAAVVSVLWLAKTGSVDPRADLNPTLKAFIVVVIGGLGTIRGAVIGGLMLGLFESFLTAYLPADLTRYQITGVFLILMILLTARPQGIAGRTVELSK